MYEDSDAGGCVMTHHIHRVAVLGAGTMGAAVAAHAANAGLLVDLLDIVPPDAKGKDRNSIVKAGFERMLKAKAAGDHPNRRHRPRDTGSHAHFWGASARQRGGDRQRYPELYREQDW